MKRYLLIGGCLLGLFIGAQIAIAEVRYSVTDLGTVGSPYDSSLGMGINSSGQVVGASFYTDVPPPGQQRAVQSYGHIFIYDGSIHDLGSLNPYSYSLATSINNTGQIVGYDSYYGSAVVYTSSTGMVDLNSLIDPNSGWSLYQANSINDVGLIAGTGGLIPYGYRAYRYDTHSNELLDIGSLGGNNSYGTGINSHGAVVGYSELVNDRYQHAFLYDGTIHDLGTLSQINPIYSYSAANAINANGQVTGTSQVDGSFGSHAFLYDGSMHDLGTLDGNFSSVGNAINDFGAITGQSDDHAFVYTGNGGMLDLNSLIDTSSGWVLTSGQGINDAGQITGYGTINGQEHAFLLTSVPEPSSFLFAGLGFFAIWRSVRRSS